MYRLFLLLASAFVISTAEQCQCVTTKYDESDCRDKEREDSICFDVNTCKNSNTLGLSAKVDGTCSSGILRLYSGSTCSSEILSINLGSESGSCKQYFTDGYQTRCSVFTGLNCTTSAASTVTPMRAFVGATVAATAAVLAAV
eukprot:NODE_847_length_678_cov_326.807631_g777_i0.p1 GENE.NODE_847_length_678_cov_326.807631_g777_i0~~NODE_847_length_678_cov_326.807631_g777_i0.p1  ORF type:complete len:143 (-),score=20.52 NODE_847_length_678_cov_326.807631_g777_i0:183-611(-)